MSVQNDKRLTIELERVMWYHFSYYGKYIVFFLEDHQKLPTYLRNLDIQESGISKMGTYIVGASGRGFSGIHSLETSCWEVLSGNSL